MPLLFHGRQCVPTVRFISSCLVVSLALVVGACGQADRVPTAPIVAPNGPSFLVVSTGYSQVSAGDWDTCAVLVGNTVNCWGYNGFGEASVPAGLTDVAQVSSGSHHTCALKTDGSVTCWGLNNGGQTDVPLSLGGITQLDAGAYHSCALKGSTGVVSCWGYQANGQSTVPPALSAVQVSAGAFHSCAVTTGGTVTCWGLNDYGQRTVPANFTGVTQVSAGNRHTCARTGTGTVRCWGGNYLGQILVPPGLSNVVGVSAGEAYSCALKNDGSVTCWGDDRAGQATPPPGLTGATQLSAGGFHACVLASDGGATCWGLNEDGESTVPAPLIHVLPSAVFSSPASVNAGQSFTLALGTAQVPGHPEVFAFTYAFDCGTGSGYTAASSAANQVCPTSVEEIRTVKGKVFDQGGDFAEYESTLLVKAPGATDPGTSVEVRPVDPGTGATPVTLTFESVTGEGTTTVTSSTTGGPPPLGFKMGNPPIYYELQTTATFSGAVTVCFAYTPSDFNHPSKLRLLHGGAGSGWTDVTTSNDPINGTICGTVTSLSPFILAELHYDFVGFFQPVDNPGSDGIVNSVKAGSAVPVKFSLGGNLGLDVLAENSPSSSLYTCGGGAEAAVEETVTAGASSLNYDVTAGKYVYVWKTNKLWSGTCRKLRLILKDGTVQEALFKFSR